MVCRTDSATLVGMATIRIRSIISASPFTFGEAPTLDDTHSGASTSLSSIRFVLSNSSTRRKAPIVRIESNPTFASVCCQRKEDYATEGGHAGEPLFATAMTMWATPSAEHRELLVEATRVGRSRSL